MAAQLRISALYVHPVKSCAGLRVEELTLDAMGAIDDRRFMLVDRAGNFVSQRTNPRLALVRIARTQRSGITLSCVGQDTLEVTVPSPRAAVRDAVVWGDHVAVRDCGDAAAAWLASLLGAELRLVHMPDDSVRRVDPEYAPSDARTSLADGFPLLVATDSSLADLARRVGTTLEMERFRPNIVLEGSAAWEEDHWEALHFAGVTLRLVKPCARCTIPGVDPRTAESGAEPLRTLASFRRGVDLGYAGAEASKTYFAWNALHTGTGTLRVGDVVESIERRSSARDG